MPVFLQIHKLPATSKNKLLHGRQ